MTGQSGNFRRNLLGVQLVLPPARADGVFDSIERVAGQELQNANELPHPGDRSVTGFERLTQARERLGQLPVA